MGEQDYDLALDRRVCNSSDFYAYAFRTLPVLGQILCCGTWEGSIPWMQGILDTFAYDWDRSLAFSAGSPATNHRIRRLELARRRRPVIAYMDDNRINVYTQFAVVFSA
ncbi:hypothetical protein LshimejAT787_0603090 [Lyophyllum shimeji]|uniref:Uncharacterized protein n=1 Tax=Lyophyllum shimeji TaxID=47721 RepID=A0A9P3UNB2_LYOSH|nr:hypothetical protein LshimejAT787_0603090 [Lyophyllum shimeji]